MRIDWLSLVVAGDAGTFEYVQRADVQRCGHRAQVAGYSLAARLGKNWPMYAVWLPLVVPARRQDPGGDRVRLRAVGAIFALRPLGR